MNELVAGAWREGLNKHLAKQVEDVWKRKKMGARLLPYESTVQELADLLDSYDEFYLDGFLAMQVEEPPMDLAQFKEVMKRKRAKV